MADDPMTVPGVPGTPGWRSVDPVPDVPSSGPSFAQSLINRVIADRYDILEMAGEGALLAAWRARDRALNRIVALKAVLPRYAGRADVRELLQAGLGQVLALTHPGIARVYDVGIDRSPDSEAEILFFAEEYVRGIDLKERIRRAAPFQLAAAADTAITLTEALEYAHVRGLVHGDMRPQNVLIGPDGQVKLCGFGLASAQALVIGDDPEAMKRIVPYIAPDAARAAAPTESGDLYAVGVILYELLTGELPYRGDTALQIAQRQMQDPIPSPRSVNTGVPRALDGVVRKALGKRPEERYASAAALLSDLRAVRDALKYGRSLAWSPLDGAAERTAPQAPAIPPSAPAPASPAILATPPPAIPEMPEIPADERTILPTVLPAAAGAAAAAEVAGVVAAADQAAATATPGAAAIAALANPSGSAASTSPPAATVRPRQPVEDAEQTMVMPTSASPRRPAAAPAAGPSPYTNSATGAVSTVSSTAVPPSAARQRDSAPARSARVEDTPIVTQNSGRDGGGGGGNRWLLTLNLFLLLLAIGGIGGLVWLTFYISPASEVVVPNLVGRSITEARHMASDQHFDVAIVDEQFLDTPAKDVIYQMNPQPGRHIRPGKSISVWVSKGPRMVDVPDVRSTSFDKARIVIEKTGLKVGDYTFEYDTLEPKGNVVRQDPAAGESRPRNSPVNLVLSKGEEPPPTPVPDLPIPPESTPFPEATPKPDSGSTDSGDSEADARVRTFDIRYPVPSDNATHRIRIDVIDRDGTRTVFDDTSKAGGSIKQRIEAVGKQIRIRLFDNDELKSELVK